MSSSQLDDLNDQEGDEAIAKALGISVDELEDLDYGSVETNESNDGLIYSYYIDIQKESSSEEVLNKVMAYTNYDDYSDYITAYLEFENYPDDDQDHLDDDERDYSDGNSQNGSKPTKPISRDF